MRFATYFLNLILLVGITGMAYGQSNAPLASTPGAPSGSYQLDNFDTVNLFSGNLNVSLPLAQLSGRGEFGIGVSVNIEHQWQITETAESQTPGDLEFEISNKPLGIIGSVGSVHTRSNSVDTRESCDEGRGEYWLWHDSLNVTVVLPDGTEQILIDPYYKGKHFGCWWGPPNVNYGRFFQSVDGTFTTFVADADIYSRHGILEQPIDLPVSGYFYRKDGSKTRVEDGKIVWIQDRNGNKSSFSYPPNSIRPTNLKDSLGREIQIEYDVTEPAPYGFCHRITLKGAHGEDRIIRVSLGVTLRNPVPGTDDDFGITGMITTNPNDRPQVRGGIDDWSRMPKAIWLPDGRTYEFKYNINGRIAEIKLPTGGRVEYDFYPTKQDSIYLYDWFINRVKEKRTFDEDNALVGKTVFTKEAGAGTVVTVENRDSGNNLLKKSRHYFYGNADSKSFFSRWAGRRNWWGDYDGKERMTEEFDLDGTSVLVRIERTLRPKIDPACYDDPNMENPCNLPSYPHVPNSSPMVVETKTTLVDSNQVSVVSNINPISQIPALDSFNNFTDTWVYDFGAGQKGNLLKRTHTDYVTSSNYTGIYLRDLPIQSWVSSDINGNTKASLTQFEYDNYTTDAGHAVLVSRSNVVGHDTTNYGTSNIRRGNVTAVTSYADAQAQTGAITAYSQYDILGNVVKTIDAKGCASTSNYDDNFGAPDGEAQTNTPPSQLNGLNTFAFPKSATNCMGWVTGYSQVDYFTGASVNTEDLNGVISKTIYNDPLDRPTQSVSAIGTAFERQSNIVYDDANRRIETKSDLFALNDNLIKAESFYDGLGRTFESRSYKDGGYVVSKSEFDALGRVKRVTNPYRPHLSEQELWTESFYDALGRVTKIKTPDNAEALTTYSGNAVTVTDQAGKLRRSITNALGQLIRVDEPNASNQLGTVASPNQATHYAYDTLNNLTTVSQGVQTRTFAYNSLSRLLSATNPESGTINYIYDNNGNLTRKTDARGVQTDYIYDALNRVTNRNYSTPGGTPPNYQATPNVTYTYDDPLIANSKGKLTKVTNGTSVTDYISFNILSGVTRSKQTTDGVVYGDDANPMTYTYNLSGALIEQKYPSGRVVKNVLDNDGDLSMVQSKKNQNFGYHTYVSSFTYNAAGAATSLQLGNGKWESTTFNSRLQPTQIALGTVQNGHDKLKLDYEYGALNPGTGQTIAGTNNGNVSKQTITVATVGMNPGFVATQYYAYDSLNRIQIATENITPEGQPADLSWRQQFTYDRYGNRNFDEVNTTTLPKNCGTPPNQTVCPADIPIFNPSVNTANNRLNGYTFDSSGNTTQDAELRKFTYDGENKQVKVETVNSGGTVTGTVGEYIYDGDGKRVKKKGYTNSVLTEETIFVYDAAGKLVAEYSNDVASVNDAKVAYLTNDHLGSPRINTDQNGTVTARHDYHPFGEEIGTLTPPFNGSTHRTAVLGYTVDSIRKQFTGYERDNESSLDFAEARYYGYNHGRYTSPDPLMASARRTNPQTFNRYTYVLNNPYSLVDPSGMMACPPDYPNCQTDKDGDYIIDDDGVKAYIDSSPSSAIQSEAGCTINSSCSQNPSAGFVGPPPVIAPGAPAPVTAPPPGAAPSVGRVILGNIGRTVFTTVLAPAAVILALPGTVQAPAPAPAGQTTTTTTTDKEPPEGPVYVRFGPQPETLVSLTTEAALAEANPSGQYPHGVSVFLFSKAPSGSRAAPVGINGIAFEVRQTGPRPNHYTVILPKPVNQTTVNRFNLVFTPR